MTFACNAPMSRPPPPSRIRIGLLGLTLTLGAFAAQDRSVFTEAPAVVAYTPMVYHDAKLLPIEDVFRGAPIVVIDGQKTTLRRPPPVFAFVPAAAFSSNRLLGAENLQKRVSTRDRGARLEFAFESSSEQVLGLASVRYPHRPEALYLLPFKVGPVEPANTYEVAIPVPLPGGARDRAFKVDFFLFDEAGPLLGGATRGGAKTAETSSDQFFRNLVAHYLSVAPPDAKMQLIHHPLPVAKAGETSLRRILFQTRFNADGRVDRVEVDRDQAPEAVIEAGVRALFGWRGLPAIVDGQAVPHGGISPRELPL